MDTLIKRMLQLYAEFSAQLFRIRVEKARMRHGEAGDVDLAGPLIEWLRQCAGESTNRREEQALLAAAERPGAHEASKIENPTTSWTPLPTPIPPLAPGKRVPGLSPGVGAVSFQPPLGEHLEKETFRYMAQALVCARQGNVEAAEVCAKAAESALKLAAHYLPEEEYRRFKDEVMSRLTRSGDRLSSIEPEGAQPTKADDWIRAGTLLVSSHITHPRGPET